MPPIFSSFPSRVFLAPLAGVNDAPFRELCRRNGCGLAFTGMISAEAVVRGDFSSADVFDSEDRVALQLFGSTPHSIAKAGAILEKRFPQVCLFDLNFGCPAVKVRRQGSGSLLLSNPSKVGEIVSALCSSISAPVSAKIRLGPSSKNLNFAEVGLACESGGASLVTLHARTFSQNYSKKADWLQIRILKESLSIPVCGNGDVSSANLCAGLFSETNCDFAMVGRAAMRCPLIFRQCNSLLSGSPPPKADFKSRLELVFSYLLLCSELGGDFGVQKANVLQLTRGLPSSASLRNALCRRKTLSGLESALCSFSSSQGSS